ncbi:hypothetical protein R84981_000983 [Carnimonas sp. R-84981]|uniref:hypothetical protein n=1 Tax=Carnimonas bestiolae TaxID=3402172 RepID=UPI003EDB93ED
MSLTLSEINKLATIDDGYVERSVSWTNDDGQTYTFEVELKREQSAADFEFINYGPQPVPKRDSAGKLVKDDQGNIEFLADSEASINARRVARMVRLKGGQAIPYETVKKWKSSLILLLSSKQLEVEEEVPDRDVVKNG